MQEQKGNIGFPSEKNASYDAFFINYFYIKCHIFLIKYDKMKGNGEMACSRILTDKHEMSLWR